MQLRIARFRLPREASISNHVRVFLHTSPPPPPQVPAIIRSFFCHIYIVTISNCMAHSLFHNSSILLYKVESVLKLFCCAFPVLFLSDLLFLTKFYGRPQHLIQTAESLSIVEFQPLLLPRQMYSILYYRHYTRGISQPF